MADVLIIIGIALLIAFAIALTWALCIAAEDDDTRKREKWSRSLDEKEKE